MLILIIGFAPVFSPEKWINVFFGNKHSDNISSVSGPAEVSELSSRLTSESRIYADKAKDLNRQVSLIIIIQFLSLLFPYYCYLFSF